MIFKALLAAKDGDKISTDLVEVQEKDLMSGDVTIAVDYSTVNYKDRVALAGRAPIIQTFPLIPGIDLRVGYEGRQDCRPGTRVYEDVGVPASAPISFVAIMGMACSIG
jgi:acrylyl-CoA reductase (NADPH)